LILPKSNQIYPNLITLPKFNHFCPKQFLPGDAASIIYEFYAQIFNA